MNFSKAFDVVPHQQLINKLDYYGIHGHLKCWLTNWLVHREQSVVVDSASSSSVCVFWCTTRNCFRSVDVPFIYK